MSLLPAVLDLNASSHSFIIDLHDCSAGNACTRLNSTKEVRFREWHVIGMNSRSLVEERFNWSRIGRQMTEVYD